ncbi:cellulose biosynthesis protein BcsE [Escherichia coli]|nr:cellulose biosynthesis protein BcsE [Escherichia coli]
MRDIVDPVFSIGISSLWDELRHMPAGGVWWFNVDRHEDAISLANQTIASQAETAHVAVISMDSDPAKIFQLDDSQGPEKIKLFSMLNHEKGLYYLTRDLQCSIDPHNYLFILVCANNAWQNIPAERLRSWLDKMNKWSRLNHCSLLVINPGNNNDKQFSLLLEEYRSLFGLASLRFQGDQHLLDIAFWCNEKGVSARQQLSVQQQNGIWTLVQSEEAEIQPRSDEKRILSNVAVLEGAPPLSEHWQLFNNNEVLFNEARTAQAATVVFSLQQNAQIEPLARSIHTLRRQRGSAMKILVRENTASLRATDERLLLACGANMVIPWNAPLSRCLTMIESVQGQKFSRYVPEDIMTIGGNRLVLFLSFCRINDLDTALNHIFPLPTGDIFSNRMVWFEDDQISAELVQMRLLAPEQWGMPLPLTQSSKPVINAEHDGRHWRRIPEPMRLLDDAVERSS